MVKIHGDDGLMINA